MKRKTVELLKDINLDDELIFEFAMPVILFIVFSGMNMSVVLIGTEYGLSFQILASIGISGLIRKLAKIGGKR